MAILLPIYKFETWVGALGSVSGNIALQWSPSSTCSYITEAVTTIYQDIPLVTRIFQTAFRTSQYRMNLMKWLTTNCLPTNWVTGTANYYYPGACPEEWTSRPSFTTMISIVPSKTATIEGLTCMGAGGSLKTGEVRDQPYRGEAGKKWKFRTCVGHQSASQYHFHRYRGLYLVVLLSKKAAGTRKERIHEHGVARSEDTTMHDEERGHNGVFTSLDDLKLDGRAVDAVLLRRSEPNWTNRHKHRGVADAELEDQTRLAELDGTDREQGIVRGPLPETAALYSEARQS